MVGGRSRLRWVRGAASDSLFLTRKEYRMAVKMRKKGLPYCHREFMEFMNALQNADFDDEQANVQAALKVLQTCYDETEAKKTGQKPSINYHLARYTRKDKFKT